jgi:2-iminobutanoate/2-iminopropanoate deaminase
MENKQVFRNKNLPDFSNAFSWGLKVIDFKEICFVTGQADCNPEFITECAGVPIVKTRPILSQMKGFLEEDGFTIHDIVRTGWAFVNEVDGEQFTQIAAIW